MGHSDQKRNGPLGIQVIHVVVAQSCNSPNKRKLFAGIMYKPVTWDEWFLNKQMNPITTFSSTIIIISIKNFSYVLMTE